ncbi:MAG: hypothetical protein EXS03_05390 [Phycisphaerales bacterium]|nr:hypothetical protein [Phycisphaerales bacterium]
MNYKLLRRRCEIAGVLGREERVRDMVKKEIKGLFDSTRTDSMGSLDIHTVTEMVDKGDLNATVDLLAVLLGEL